MDVPAVRKRHGLFAVQLGTENSSDLIKSEAEARGYGAGCEPAFCAYYGCAHEAYLLWLGMDEHPARNRVPVLAHNH